MLEVRQPHIALVVLFTVILPLVISAATLERDALQSGAGYVAMLAAVGVAWAAARYRTEWTAAADEAPVFDAEPEDRALTLELWDTRVQTIR